LARQLGTSLLKTTGLNNPAATFDEEGISSELIMEI
jgi:hypothetical protein